MPDPGDTVILVFDADGGVVAMLLDVVKKAAGREDCALCEMTYGPLGHRRAWSECVARLAVNVEELHRDRVPVGWGLGPRDLPCILVRTGDDVPTILLARDEIAACARDVLRLEARLHAALDARARTRGGSQERTS